MQWKYDNRESGTSVYINKFKLEKLPFTTAKNKFEFDLSKTCLPPFDEFFLKNQNAVD